MKSKFKLLTLFQRLQNVSHIHEPNSTASPKQTVWHSGPCSHLQNEMKPWGVLANILQLWLDQYSRTLSCLPFAPLLHNKFMCTSPCHRTCHLLIQMLNVDCGSSLCQSIVPCCVFHLLKSTIILILAGDLDAAASFASL